MAKLNGLRFLEALEYAKVGNRIRRATYDGGVVYFYVPKEVALWSGECMEPVKHDGSLCVDKTNRDDNGIELALLDDFDILADDWEIVA